MDQQSPAIRARWNTAPQSLRRELSPEPRSLRSPLDVEEPSPDSLSRRIRSARERTVGLRDTPVDPLQLVWLVDRERDDFVNF